MSVSLTISLTLQYHIAILLRLYTMICHMTPAGSLELYGCQCFYRTTIIPLTGFDNRSLYVCACTSFGRGKEGHSDCDCTCQYTHVQWSRVNMKQVYCSLGGPEHPQTISIMGTNSGSGNVSTDSLLWDCILECHNHHWYNPSSKADKPLRQVHSIPLYQETEGLHSR